MFRFMTPRVDLEDEEGEQILHYARRHWLLLLQRVTVPLVIMILTLGVGLYRAAGGLFFPGNVGVPNRLFDISNIIFFGLLTVLLVLWLRSNRDAKKKKKAWFGVTADALLVLGMALLIVMIYFRYQGGRVFYIDPAYARGADIINIVLFLIALTAFGSMAYSFIDWANDFLILTTTRVIYDDTQLLVRHVKQEILIDNIQQIDLKAQSYFAHFLGNLNLWRQSLLYNIGLRKDPPPAKSSVAYGNLSVSSLGLSKIQFTWCADPSTMQQRINGEVSKLRKQQDLDAVRQLIDDQVYGNKPPKKNPPPIHVEEHHGMFPWLFATNPEIDYKKEEITWRPFWIFLLLAMSRPLAVLIVSTIILVIVVRLQLLTSGIAFLIWLPIAIGSIARIVWIREEHENDKYILNREKVIDIDKRPFGPESQRNAQLDKLQDVRFDQGYIESWLGFGDVIIETGGSGGKLTFRHVPDPENVARTITDYMTDFKKRERERAQQATVAMFKHYHDMQIVHDELVDKNKLDATVSAKVAEYADKEIPARVEREVASHVSAHVRRQVNLALRRSAARNRILRRRSES